MESQDKAFYIAMVRWNTRNNKGQSQDSDDWKNKTLVHVAILCFFFRQNFEEPHISFHC